MQLSNILQLLHDGMNIGSTEKDSEAAYTSAIFYGTIAAGRIIAVPLSVYLDTTTMIRLQLSISSIGAILFASTASINYVATCFASAVFGLGLSSIFPLMMVLPHDFNMIM